MVSIVLKKEEERADWWIWNPEGPGSPERSPSLYWYFLSAAAGSEGLGWMFSASSLSSLSSQVRSDSSGGGEAAAGGWASCAGVGAGSGGATTCSWVRDDTKSQGRRKKPGVAELTQTHLFKGIQEVSHRLFFVQILNLPFFLWHRHSSCMETIELRSERRHHPPSFHERGCRRLTSTLLQEI